MASMATAALTQGEQRALASFIAGRLPAGQLCGELSRAREEALARAAANTGEALALPAPAAPAATPAPALHPA
jgi:hypothetical protein